MKKKTLLALLLSPILALAQSGPIQLCDTTVAAGGAIDCGGTGAVLNLYNLKIKELQVFVDNTAGTALRPLTLTSYLDDGSTVIDTVVLRSVAFGVAPTGSSYAPGQVRGYVGPNPPGGTSGKHVIWRDTSASNTAITSPNVSMDECDSVQMFAYQNTGGATIQCSYRLVVDDGFGAGLGIMTPTTSVTSGPCYLVLGLGALGNLGSGTGTGVQGMSVPPPRRMVSTTTASSVGTTTTELLCNGRVPGTFSVQMNLTQKAKITLGAAGSGAARVTVFGYR
jgi:hypothetical protein